MCSRVHQGATNADPTVLQNAAAVVMQARLLADASALESQPMRGKKLALFSEALDDESHREFIQAATALGAHVSLVMPGLHECSTTAQINAVARLFSRLYDAVECQHLPVELVRRLAESADIPIFAGLATPEHATAELAHALDSATPLPVRRRRVLQAVLLLSVN